MFIRKLFLISIISIPIFAGIKNLTLNHAIHILKKDNLELKVARFKENMKSYEAKAARGHNYGKLDLSVTGMRSNDAGNVFGFKLQSREATFGDFGFSEFDMSGKTNPLPVAPKSLNYPDPKNHYQTKLKYVLPIYTGGKLSEYGHITDALYRMSKYDTRKLLNEKVFQVKKAFYDISLVEHYISNLSKIMRNIRQLNNIVKSMRREGYAKNVDVLEVEARKAEAMSMYNQAKLNRDLAYQFLSFLLNKNVSSIRRVSDRVPMPHITKASLEARNIDIQKALLGKKIAKMAVNVERSNFLPTVGAFAEYSSANDVLFKDFRDKDAYTVGVQVKMNLFNGGIDLANLEKAKVRYLMVANQVLLAKKGIALKAKKLKTEILSTNGDIRSYAKQLRFAKRVYRNYKARYKEGMVSISDVLIKQSKELEVLLKSLTAKNKRNTKVFELEALINQEKTIKVYNVKKALK